MNCILTETVNYRGREIAITDLKPSSNIDVLVSCIHGERHVRWSRISQWCRKCTAASGKYRTAEKGRDVSWGDKISQAKKGVTFSELHKLALAASRKKRAEAVKPKKLKKALPDPILTPLKDKNDRYPFFYMLCGQSGVGKTTLANEFHDKFNVISYDKVSTQELDNIIRHEWLGGKPVLLEIPMRISTTIKRYQHFYNIDPIFLIEDECTVTSRILSRGGKTANVEKRYIRMQSLKQRYGVFDGTYEEVQQYLTDIPT